MPYTKQRQKLIKTCLAMSSSGINQGTSGNISCRLDEEHFLITPSGIAYEDMTPDQIVTMALNGEYEGRWKPSSEWRMHADIYKVKEDANAVLHAHPAHATALSCLRQDVPAFHYMIGITGTNIIKCAPYALFGTKELSKGMMQAFGQGNTCLLSNHGMTCFSSNLDNVLKLAIEVENLCRQYILARSIGTPALLSKEEMNAALALFKDYGRQE